MEPADVFKVLSVETRVRIIERLKSGGPAGTKDLAAALGITPAAVSQHLKILRQAGLVRSERNGYWIPYSIDEQAMEQCRQLLNEVCTCGCLGSGKIREAELADADLETLRRYESELVHELQNVRQRARELGSKKEGR